MQTVGPHCRAQSRMGACQTLPGIHWPTLFKQLWKKLNLKSERSQMPPSLPCQGSFYQYVWNLARKNLPPDVSQECSGGSWNINNSSLFNLWAKLRLENTNIFTDQFFFSNQTSDNNDKHLTVTATKSDVSEKLGSPRAVSSPWKC